MQLLDVVLLQKSPEFLNPDALSATIISGNPCVAKIILSFSIVTCELVDNTGMVVIHLEGTSATIKYNLPLNGEGLYDLTSCSAR